MGWVIPQADEHDPFELLSVILNSIEEESQKPKKIGCLSDALGDNITARNYNTMPGIPARPSSAMLTDFENEIYNESTNLIRLVRSEAHTPDSPHSTATDNDNDNDDNSMMDETSDPPSGKKLN
jgi:ubiquitin carboxyl-terminal hydrolase 30